MSYAFIPECPITGSGTADLTTAFLKYLTLEDVTSPDFMRAPVRPSPEPTPWYSSAIISFGAPNNPTATMHCDGEAPQPYTLSDDFLRIGEQNWTLPTPPYPLAKSADPATLEGSATQALNGGLVVTTTWKLVGAES